MLIGKLSKTEHSQSSPLFHLQQPMHLLMAVNSITLLQLWQIYTHLLSVSTLTLKFGSVFHYLCGISLSLLSEPASIYTYLQSFLSDNKSQIHQPPCQAPHPWATEHSPVMLPNYGIPWIEHASPNPLSFIKPFLSLTY